MHYYKLKLTCVHKSNKTGALKQLNIFICNLKTEMLQERLHLVIHKILSKLNERFHKVRPFVSYLFTNVLCFSKLGLGYKLPKKQEITRSTKPFKLQFLLREVHNLLSSSRLSYLQQNHKL